MSKYVWPLAVAFTTALTSLSHASALHKRASHPAYLYVRDYNYSVTPANLVEGRFSRKMDRACKIVDPNMKVPLAHVQLVNRYRCPTGEGVNQFVVLR
jgi:hypothetical protein